MKLGTRWGPIGADGWLATESGVACDPDASTDQESNVSRCRAERCAAPCPCPSTPASRLRWQTGSVAGTVLALLLHRHDALEHLFGTHGHVQVIKLRVLLHQVPNLWGLHTERVRHRDCPIIANLAAPLRTSTPTAGMPDLPGRSRALLKKNHAPNRDSLEERRNHKQIWTVGRNIPRATASGEILSATFRHDLSGGHCLSRFGSRDCEVCLERKVYGLWCGRRGCLHTLGPWVQNWLQSEDQPRYTPPPKGIMVPAWVLAAQMG